jgi:uncharacterized protein (DUF2237 family)
MDFSVYVSQKPSSNHGFDGVQKRTRERWVEDASVTACFKCHSEFGWFNTRHHCLAAGTQIAFSGSPSSTIPIEEMYKHTGKHLLVWDAETQAITTGIATHFLDQGEQDTWKLTLEDGRTIVATAEHEFLQYQEAAGPELSASTTFVKLSELKIGHLLVVVADWPNWLSLAIVSIKSAGRTHVYDLTVPNAESFVANGIVVHNCRLEGQIFCGACTSKRAIIPADVPIPEPLQGSNEGRDASIPVRVCDDCFIKLHQLRRVYERPSSWKGFTAFIEWVQDIRDLKRLSLVCLEWNKIANYHLTRFFELQYHLPGRPYKPWQRDMLWVNRAHFPGHSRWMLQLIRSLEYQTTSGLSRIQELKQLIGVHLRKPVRQRLSGDKSHWNLMCTRACRSYGFTLEEIMVALDESVPNESVRRLLLEYLDSSSEPDRELLMCFAGYLVHHMSTADCAINESIIGSWLLKQCATDARLANEVYWEMVMRSNPTGSNAGTANRTAHIYRYWIEKWLESVPKDTINRVMLARTFAEGCNQAVPFSSAASTSSRSGSGSSGKRSPTATTQMDRPSNAVQAFFRKTDKVLSPTNIEVNPARIALDRVVVMPSITRPIKIPLLASGQGTCVLWKAEDIRKDHIVMSFIRLCDHILKRELGIDFRIVTYNVRPVRADAGFIEMVPEGSCTTLYDMDNMFTFVDGNIRMEELRDNFVKSCAAYSTLTFLLGAGDRHLHNIMITRDARLFHIDYGYVMGADPKKKFGISLTRVPDMRIDQNIVAMLGSADEFQKFKNMVDQIYNCLRRHVEPLTALLRILVLSEPAIHIQTGFNERRLMKEIVTRFAPGENHEEARIQIINRIDNSTRSQLHYTLVDTLHHQAQTNVVIKAISSGWHTLRTYTTFL